MTKSTTDLYWNDRAITEQKKESVNIADHVQRDLEIDALLKNIHTEDNLLEVGCGNGFLTNILREHVTFVDAFDYAENMVAQARALYGERNNRFFHDNVLNPSHWSQGYDTIVCVRVLINLRNLEEQAQAVRNMYGALKPHGRLLLFEGYINGFEALNELRLSCGIEKLIPAKINCYSPVEELCRVFEDMFTVQEVFHTGCFDFLTRLVYPALAGSEKALGPGEFHNKIHIIAKKYNPVQFAPLARVRGFLLTKRA